MLKQLLGLKQHREEGLLQALNEKRIRLDKLLQQAEELKQEALLNREQWRASNEETRLAARNRLGGTLKNYNQFYDQAKHIEGMILQNSAEQEKIEQQRVSLQADLHANRIEQEKLNYMLAQQK